MYNEHDIREFADQLRNLYLSGGEPLDRICQTMARVGTPQEVITKARILVEAAINQSRDGVGPDTLADPTLGKWYPGPADGQPGFWSGLKTGMMESGWEKESLDALNTETTRIVSLLAHPGVGNFNRRGLVVGYVQSGKTANFTAVIAKAADSGYKFFIILSGITNKLRRQTQRRFDKDLISRDRTKWVSLTNDHEDFNIRRGGNVDAFLTRNSGLKTVCIVKKIPLRLRRLGDWLKGARPEVLSACPVLIIDDEADEASINTSTVRDVRSKANEQICRILGMLPKVSYVGYTATPFANIFIDPSDEEDLYPRDFIVDLPRKKTYFGAERLFGRADLSPDESEGDRSIMDVVTVIPQEEATHLRPPRTRPTGFGIDLSTLPTLRHAIRWFWLATACRRLRRGNADFHSSMLVHSHQAVAVHNAFRRPIERFRDESIRLLLGDSKEELDEFCAVWNLESRRVKSTDFGHDPTSFNELVEVLRSVVQDTKVVIENYTAVRDERLSYDEDDPQTVIVVGGAILARGLTLEGLVASVFVRSGSAYDTLLQMGRWFGYRRGYEDLPRVWMSRELREYFYDLATVEEEIRRDIARYAREGLTPLQFGPKVRTHPALMITSRLKMQNAVRCSASFDEKRVQTTIFKHRDSAWLLANIDASRALIRRALAVGAMPNSGVGGRTVFRGVDASVVREFLITYRIHERHPIMQDMALVKYVDAEIKAGSLRLWNIVVAGHSEPALGEIDLGGGVKANLIRRSKLKDVGGEEFANVKALMQEVDICCDLPDWRGGGDRSAMFDARNAQAPGIGLLVLYPVAKDSRADAGSGIRADMDAVEHIIGLGLVLPKTVRASGSVDYMASDLSWIEVDEIELPEEVLSEAQE